MVMARTDDDSWDITESVGATALGVAMARAAESDCDCPLFTDRYAQLFVDAAVKRGWDSSTTSSDVASTCVHTGRRRPDRRHQAARHPRSVVH